VIKKKKDEAVPLPATTAPAQTGQREGPALSRSVTIERTIRFPDEEPART
jgi:hypothetical protein